MGIRIGALLLLLAVAGCGGSRKDVLSAHDAGKGTERTFPLAFDAAWDATKAAIAKDAETVEEHRAERYMLGSEKASVMQLGSAMGAWLDPVDASHTRVRVIVSRTMATNVLAASEDGILDEIAKAVPAPPKAQ